MRFLWVVFALPLCISGAASACSTLERMTDEQQFERAAEVFLARVVRTEASTYRDIRWPGNLPVVDAQYELIEALKGSPPASGVVRDFVFGPGNCSLGLLTGVTYLFFVDDESRLVLIPSGSRGIINTEAESVKQLLAKLRALPRNH